MEAFKLTGKSKGGVLTVHVPEEFDGRNLEVIILSLDEQNRIATQGNPSKEKTKRLLSIIGSAADKTTNFDKHDVYDQ
ncbi:hypothetical protein [Foetidibacter luteolus]|uniref:hypothetical protein n=1 Tax=Foetidibacter luteolus TaxID=2608880 RepID=UPI00129AE80D|nr:hypothetical protein [Foetidibacter luteolus]